MFIRGLLLALSFVLGLHSPSLAAGHIVGKVVDVETSDPVEGAQVMLMPIMTPGSMPTAMMPTTARTDAQGTFRFDAVAPGRYRAQATKSGMATVIDPSPEAVITIAGDETVAVRDLGLRRGGVIAGRVVDTHGNAVPELMVMVEPMTRERPSSMAVPAQTNDLGEFRVAGVAPGEFYVIARPRPTPFVSGSAAAGFVGTFYPGTTDRSRAVPVTVAAGQTTTGVEITIQTGALFTVSGVVVDDAGAALTDVTVTLAPEAGGPGTLGFTRVNADGSFTITGVQAGSYRLMSMRMVLTSAGGGSGTQAVSLTAVGDGRAPTTTPVAVTTANVTGLRIVLRRE